MLPCEFSVHTQLVTLLKNPAGNCSTWGGGKRRGEERRGEEGSGGEGRGGEERGGERKGREIAIRLWQS